MKTFFIFTLLMCLPQSYSYAQKLNFGSESKNADGSVTFRDLLLEDENGEKKKIALDNGAGYARACQQLKFDSSLGYGGLGLNTYTSDSSAKLEITEDGQIVKSTSSNYIEKVTCYKLAELKDAFTFTKEVNPDGSETYTNLKYLRGDGTFDIAMESSYDYLASCRLLGLGKTLLYSGRKEKTAATDYSKKVKLDINGKFSFMSDTKDYVTKITCLTK